MSVLTGLAMIAVTAASCSKAVYVPGEQERREAGSTLRYACSAVSIAIADRPAGGGCTSMSQAVWQVTTESRISPWKSTYAASSAVHLNPDWRRWRSAATNDGRVERELATFCTPAILGPHGAPVYAGMTFGGKMVNLLSPPSWPAATNWLSVVAKPGAAK